MVVTCENCSARYKLDDSRISGRGAKITCPRCRHVFVVYKERSSAQAEGRVAVGGGVATPASPPPAPKPAAPQASPSAAASAESEVDNLDFRKVGVQAWKVKVKIGLVYDFSDYRTLARYIAEGRVTASDKLSYDGSEWTEISQIPDLAAHFVSVYRQLEAAQAAAEEEDDEEDYEDDEPTNIMGMGGASFEEPAGKAVSLTSFSSSASSRILPSSNGPSSGGADLQSAMSAALDAEAGDAPKAPVGPRFIDPFEKRKNSGRTPKPRGPAGSTSGGRPRPKPRKTSKEAGEASAGGGRGLLLAALGLLALGAAGFWWYSNQDVGGGPSTANTVRPPLQSGEADKSRDDIRKEIEADILEGTEVEAPEGGDDPVEDEAWGGDDDTPELIPVGPRGPSRPTAKSGSSIPAASSARSARDYAADGDSAMKRRDYRSAISAYQKAVGMEPSNSVYNGRLGAAMVRAGQMDSAMEPLMRAAGGGYSPAFVYLGDIAAARGDNAGAIGHYQSYLATNPRDASTVQAKIDRLSG